MKTWSTIQPQAGVWPHAGVWPLAGVWPQAGVWPLAGVWPQAGVWPAGDAHLELNLSGLRGVLARDLGTAPRVPVQRAPGTADWLAQGPGARAQSLLLEALGGWRVAVVEGGVHVERLVDDGARPSWQTQLRLCQPPRELLQAQAARVDLRLPLRESLAEEIHQQAQGAAACLIAVAGLSPERHPRSLEFLAAALGLQQALQMRCKQLLAVPRPQACQQRLLPLIETPAHASLPSGHAGESYLLAALLARWTAGRDPELPTLLRRLALRVADNRVVAGLHYPIDSLAGRLLGRVVERHLLQAVGAETAGLLAGFGLEGWSPADAEPGEDEELAPEYAPLCQGESDGAPAASLPDHRRLWQLACAEWS